MQAEQTPDPGTGDNGQGTSQPGETGLQGHNALGGEPSAYLRQHAHNPVHWQPFGDHAFADAAARDVPVFLSVGYAACHWCHVMAHESFEDQATADYLNSYFVAVKVDREERPDVDAVYMAATQAISGQGGWPMSVFLTPDGLAFHAGTYFPPRPMPGRPSFVQVLEAVHDAWTERRDAVEQNARSLARNMGHAQLSTAVDLSGPPELIDAGLLSAAVRSLAAEEDSDGGFGNAPKFPPSAVLEFLIRHAAVPSETAGEARDMAGRTLAAMARSALYDQLDGGFARYSVTRDWSVPHFEKMLYDNAQLLRVYVHWIRLGGTAGFPAAEAADVAGRTADWMLASLGLPKAGAECVALASSLDADSAVNGEHHEGASYLWTIGGLEQVLGAADAAAVAWIMNVGAAGTVSELGSPLHPGRPLAGEEAEAWVGAQPRLREARASRPQPARDDKVVAGWNGLAAAALAEAGAILGRRDLVAAAERIAAYLEQVHWRAAAGNPAEGELIRVSHDGEARGIGGLLEDYAFCADGFLTLYYVTGDARWYGLSEAVISAACRRFVAGGRLADFAGESKQVSNAQGGQPGLDPFDNATPSGAAAFAGVLLSYAALSGSAEHRTMAGNIMSLLPPIAARAPRVAGWLLATAQAALAGPVEAAVVGPSGPGRDTLHRALLLAPSPGLVVAVSGAGTAADAPELPGAVPLLRGRTASADGTPLVYVCRDMVCNMPVATVTEVLERVSSARQ
ncbi:thioredoxin domain-containing protein [Arthrobacter sp. ISL-5]|uniref:thioredoxin domain-containing protein n=1 Tax=Arthrobacter sp. ISL-5 TaxID=2819111 RepID=UPI001BEC993C|nr:thioredoxin domain-containing protein [Arthrobacter sp. ISL-5]MBT2555114.1 thioredoxin domain-containing protein [Arthrobacter sp. ISL-5]